MTDTIPKPADSAAATAVPTWPRLTAVTHQVSPTAPLELELTYIGRSTHRTVPTEYLSRAVILSEAAQRALKIGKPIAVSVNPDGEHPLRLAVRPTGIVQELDDENRIADAAELLPAEFPCFTCHTMTSLIGPCAWCGEQHPFAREDIAHGAEQLTPIDETLERIFPEAELITAPTTTPTSEFRRRHLPWIITTAIVLPIEAAAVAGIYFALT